MRTWLPISALPFLLICASCSTTERVVSKPSVIREKVPSAYLRPCPAPRKPIVTTGDIVDLLTSTRGALSACDAQISKIRGWNQ